MKPLPHWMSLLPRNVQNEREHEQKASGSRSCCTSSGLDRKGDSVAWNHCSIPEEIDGYGFSVDESTKRAVSRSSSARLTLIDVLKMAKHCSSGMRTSVEVHTPKEDVLGTKRRRARASQTAESIYLTPPESPPLPPRPRTPYPRRSRTSRSRRSGNLKDPPSDLAESHLNIEERVQDSCRQGGAVSQAVEPCSERSPSIMSTSSHQPSVPIASQSSGYSSEYLDRYQPRAADTRHQKYVARAAVPVIDKIRRQKAAKQSMLQIVEMAAGETVNNARTVGLGNEDHCVNQMREDLRKELRHLFHEEYIAAPEQCWPQD
jgi:hypothetical protein